MTEAPVCQHLRLKPDLSATTSVIAIETHLWGVICEGCGEKWDIGQIRFIRGRLCFDDGGGRATFPSAVVVLANQQEKTP